MLIRGFLLSIVFQFIFSEAKGSYEGDPCPRYSIANEWKSLTGIWQIKRTIFHLPSPGDYRGKSEQNVCETVYIQNHSPNSFMIKWWKLHPQIYYEGGLDDATDTYLWRVTGPKKDWDYKYYNPRSYEIISPHPMYITNPDNYQFEGLVHVYRKPNDENNIMLMVCLRDPRINKKVKSFTQLLTREPTYPTSKMSIWDDFRQMQMINESFIQKYKLNEYYTITSCKGT